MLEGMFQLLKWEAKLVMAAIGFAFSAATGLLRGGTWLVRRISRGKTVPQGQTTAPAFVPIPSNQTPAPSPAATAAGTAVSVTVNTHAGMAVPPAQAAPAPPTAMPGAQSPHASGTAAILNNPDHRIYVTTGSHLMLPHPHAAELLEHLDRMLYVAAHRHGVPFTLPPALDDSRPPASGSPAMPPPLADAGIDPTPTRPLPPADAAVWVIRLGHEPARVAGS